MISMSKPHLENFMMDAVKAFPALVKRIKNRCRSEVHGSPLN